MSKYAKLNKTELLLVIEQLEQESLQNKVSTFSKEIQLLGKDLLKAVGYVYELGHKAGRLVREALPVKKFRKVEVELVPVSFDF